MYFFLMDIFKVRVPNIIIQNLNVTNDQMHTIACILINFHLGFRFLLGNLKQMHYRVIIFVKGLQVCHFMIIWLRFISSKIGLIYEQ